MSDVKIFNKLLNYISNLDLKNFEIEINQLFQIKENRSNPSLLNLYGLFFEAKKDPSKAVNIFLKCIQINADYAPPYFNLGRIYYSNGMFENSINFLDKHIAKDQSIFESYDYLAKSHYQRHEYTDSIKILELVLENFKNQLSNKQSAYVYNFLGANYNLDRQSDKSIEFYKKALDFDEKNINTITNLANAFRALGKIEEAVSYFNQGLKLDPINPKIHKDLSLITKYKNQDNAHLQSMISAFNDNKTNEKGKEILGFAISKAYDDLKDPKNASKYLVDANKNRRKDFNYSAEIDVKELHFHKKIFGNTKFALDDSVSTKAITPIFILGMPRSGTTLIEQIISSHSKVTAGDEIAFMADSVKHNIVHKDTEEFEIKYEGSEKLYLTKINEEYLKQLKKISKDNKIVTDKMPLNFKLVGLIRNSIPNAKIIHCVRDGRDTCLSIYKNSFEANAMPWAYDQEELSNYFNVYSEYMKFWKKTFTDFVFDQNYYNLINDTENQIKRLLDFCDLDFEEGCLKFYESKRAVNTASTAQVRQPIYGNSIDLWKSYEPYFPELFKNIKNYSLN